MELTKEKLVNLYLKEKIPQNVICTLFGITGKNLKEKMDKWNIKSRCKGWFWRRYPTKV